MPDVGVCTSDAGRGGGPLLALSVTSPFEVCPMVADLTCKKTVAAEGAIVGSGSWNSEFCRVCVEMSLECHDHAALCVAMVTLEPANRARNCSECG